MKRTCTAGSSISFTGPFDLGQMYVTVASYSHHNFMNKQNEENVIMPGPFLVHEKEILKRTSTLETNSPKLWEMSKYHSSGQMEIDQCTKA